MSLQRALTQVVNKTFAALGPLVTPATYQAHTNLVFRNIEEGVSIAQIVDYPLKRVAFTGFEEREIDNEAVLVTDQKVIFPAVELPVEPLTGDCIRDNRGGTWRIIRRYDSPGSLIVRAHVRLQTSPTREICVPPPCPPPPCETPPDCPPPPAGPAMKTYWGTSTADTLDSDGIIWLPYNDLVSDFCKSIDYAPSGGAALFYSYPQLWGKPERIVISGGLGRTQETVDIKLSVVTLVYPNGVTYDYYLFRIQQTQNCAITVKFV